MSHTATLVVVWGLLMVLLAATMFGSFVLAGPPSLVASLAIAFCKAGLVYWFFMHLREQSGLLRIVAVGAAAWLAIFTVLVSSDYLTRDDNRTYASGFEQAGPAEPQ